LPPPLKKGKKNFLFFNGAANFKEYNFKGCVALLGGCYAAYGTQRIFFAFLKICYAGPCLLPNFLKALLPARREGSAALLHFFLLRSLPYGQGGRGPKKCDRTVAFFFATLLRCYAATLLRCVPQP
jgi:hypothetical protein